METYTRISTRILKDKNLSPTHKLILGFLQTYQQQPDGTPTGNYWYNTQKQLAEELGLSLKTITDAIAFLEGKGLIFQPKKSKIDNKHQYKNRKAIILVDEFNELPTEFIKEEKSPRKRKKAITETLPTPEVKDINQEEITPQIEDNKVFQSIYQHYLDKENKKQQETQIDENDKPRPKQELLAYVNENGSQLGWVRALDIHKVIEAGEITTINQILNY